VATLADELLHVPPVTVLLNVADPGRHKEVLPLIVPALVVGFTVTVMYVKEEPQLLVTV
jgi:hypothetical protein